MEIRRVVPNITSSQMAESVEFYSRFLGFEVAMDMQIATGRIVTLVSPINPTAQISLVEGAPPSDSQGPITLTIEVADPDALHADAVARQMPIVYPLTTERWGVRRFHVTDPSGIVLNLMCHVT